VPKWKWTFPPEDYRQPCNDDSSSSSLSEGESCADVRAGGTAQVYDGDDSDSSSCEGDEGEPPHPLGFESRFGRTRFGLSPQSTARMATTRCGDLFNRDDEYAWNALIHIDRHDPRSPFESYLGHAPASGSSLMRDSRNHGGAVDDLVSSMDRIANLVKAASYTDQRSEYSTPSARTPLSSLSPHAQPRSTSKLLELAAECERRQQSMSRQTAQLQQKQPLSFDDSCRGFALLLEADASRVSLARERISQRRQDREAFEERERIAAEEHEAREREERELAAKEEEERLAAARALTEEERKREQQRLEKLRQAEREAEEEEAEKSAYITRAADLISMLDEARSTLKDFDKSKSVGKRRLQCKKIVNGKINTLAHDEGKIRGVARIVSEAIEAAGRDDAAASGDPVMSMGKKYLLDLLAANLIVRVQADGFNGTRGDGFPLAAMFAITSTSCEELLPVLEAHLYTVCPMTIPAMSLKGDGNSSGGDESDLMESLGMLKDKNGEYESFDKFLSRTEGLVSIMADIMSSLPAEHTLLGGRNGAVQWIERFMDTLPPAPTSPLPLLTAPVLVAFLTGAGHMLANKFEDRFRPIFEAIRNDVLSRLDDSSIGIPSATRLKKVLDKGFEGMKKELPPNAVASLYDGKEGGLPPTPTSFGTSSASPGVADSATNAAPAPGFAGFHAPSSQNMNQTQGFAPAASTTSEMESSSTAGGVNPFSSSNWGGNSNNAGAGGSTFGSPMPAQQQSPFGGSFGQNAPAPSPFGNQQPGFAPSTSAPPTQPFGGGSQPSTGFAPATAPTPFGTMSTGFVQSPSPFSQSGFGSNAAPNPSPSPFGASTFGNSSQQSGFGSSPFGSNKQSNPAPFGSNVQSSSAFGNNNTSGRGKIPCKFFQQGKCRYGANCKFSHDVVQGNPNNNSSPFGQQQNNANPSPFGGGGFGKNNPSPFGAGSVFVNPTPFGAPRR